MACMVPDVLEVEDPQATELVTDDISARKVAVDETEIVEIAHGTEEVQSVNKSIGSASWQRSLEEVATDLSCGGNWQKSATAGLPSPIHSNTSTLNPDSSSGSPHSASP